MVCGGCGVNRVVEIGMSLHGKLVVMRSCAVCGTSWADERGKLIALGKVLRLAGAAKR